MSKFDWSKARRRSGRADRDGPDAADRWLAKHDRSHQAPPRVPFNRTPYKQRKHAPTNPDGIWITVGADNPNNSTPGIRQVHHFKTRAEAHAAGFTWAI